MLTTNTLRLDHSYKKFIELDHLPKVPKSLIKYNFDQSSWTVTSDVMLTKGEKTYKGGVYLRNPLTDELKAWIKTHIIADWGDAGYSAIYPPCLGPHMDQYRLYTLQYVIDVGGPEVDTVFYDVANDHVKMEYRYKFTKYADLEPIESYRARNDTWWLIDGRNIHSVENITTCRIALQLSLQRNPIEKNLLLS